MHVRSLRLSLSIPVDRVDGSALVHKREKRVAHLLVVVALLGLSCGSGSRPVRAKDVRVASSASVVRSSSAGAPRKPPRPTAEQALAEAEEAFDKAGVETSYGVQEALAKVEEAGLDGGRALVLLQSLTAGCLSRKDACDELSSFGANPSREAKAVERLVKYVAVLGVEPAIPLLAQLGARGLFEAHLAMEDALLARVRRAKTKCLPPTQDEVAAQRQGLTSFAVLDHDGKRWKARAATAKELDDLAYLFAAVADAGAGVGSSTDPYDGAGRTLKRDETREAAQAAMKEAQLQGDFAAHTTAARQWLATLGYPGPLHASFTSVHVQGDGDHSSVMRELARSEEVLGNLEDAAALYRRAGRPGPCHGSRYYPNLEQRMGLIRVTELLEGCRAALPERLYAMAGEPDYGPERLAKAGFDVARLYRGAVLTWGREMERADLQAALAAAPGSLGAEAIARLQRQGAEAWDCRTRAWVGFADTAGKDAVWWLTARAARAPVPDQLLALDLLWRLAYYPGWDPCVVTDRGFGFGDTSGIAVRSLNHECATRLTAEEMSRVLKEISPIADSKNYEVRNALAKALGRLGFPGARPLLRKMLRDPYSTEVSRSCTAPASLPDYCKKTWPVRDTAKRSLEEIERRNRP